MPGAAEQDFKKVQREFSAYLRDPENNPRPEGLPENRLAVYRHAVFINISRFLTDNFPRVKEFYSEQEWEALVRDYIVNHRSDTMCFVELPQEFLTYLEQVREDENDHAFLYELAHFEWLETLISADPRSNTEAQYDDAHLLNGVPVVNPLAQLLRYSYPVHTLSPQAFPKEEPPEPTFIVVFRKGNNKFGYIDVNILTARLIELLASNETKSGRQVLLDIAAEMGAPDQDAIVAGGAEILEKLLADEVILGAKRLPDSAT
ncbi:MAG: HvfC family RiPP maturation protein [Gammaproteobacteria bacterium]